MSKKAHETALPKLRFPEFRGKGAWLTPTLGEVSEPITEKVGRLSLPTVSISAGTGFVLQSEKFGRDISGEQYKNYTYLRRGEFSYNKGNSKRFPQGCIYQLKEFEQAAVPNVFFSFRFKKGFLPAFYQGYFDNNFHGKQLKKDITSGARSNGLLNISSKYFFSIVLPTPSEIAEQQKVAATLSSLDALLTAQTAKLIALQAHKRGLMQDLFPAEGETVPKRRFTEFQNAGEWEKLPIGGKVSLLSGYPFKSSEISEDSSGIPLMRGINVTSGFIRHNQDMDRFFLGNSKSLDKFKLQTNDLVIGMDGSKVGKNSALITERDSGSLLIQRVARLRAKPRTSIQFIYQQINSNIFHAYVDRVNTSGGIPHISASQINSFEILFPAFEEQQKIADCLSSLDNLITAQTQKIDALKLHKKGLMQALFPTTSAPEA